jgi:DNA-binding HxlR family transcriptional regulator
MKRRTFNCPAEMTLHLIGGKWRAIVLYNLRRGPRRFGELRRLSPGISAATLTKVLRELIDADLISRSAIGFERTDGVEYELSAKGMSLKPALNALIRWGLEHQRDYVVGDFGMARGSR